MSDASRSLSERLPEAVFNRIHEDIGQASMCWQETPKGVFDSTRAADIALHLCEYVADLLEKERDQPLFVVQINKNLTEKDFQRLREQFEEFLRTGNRTRTRL